MLVAPPSRRATDELGAVSDVVFVIMYDVDLSRIGDGVEIYIHGRVGNVKRLGFGMVEDEDLDEVEWALKNFNTWLKMVLIYEKMKEIFEFDGIINSYRVGSIVIIFPSTFESNYSVPLVRIEPWIDLSCSRYRLTANQLFFFGYFLFCQSCL